MVPGEGGDDFGLAAVDLHDADPLQLGEERARLGELFADEYTDRRDERRQPVEQLAGTLGTDRSRRGRVEVESDGVGAGRGGPLDVRNAGDAADLDADVVAHDAPLDRP